MPSVFTDEIGSRDLAIITSSDWTIEAAVLPNGDSAASPNASVMADTFHTTNTDFDMTSGDWSVEFWVYLEAGSSQTVQIVVCTGTPGSLNNTRWQVYIDDSERIVFGLVNTTSGGVYKSRTSAALSTTAWYYVVCELDSGTLTIYLNKVSSSVASSGPTGTQNPPAAGDKLFLGHDMVGLNNLPSTVRIAKLAIYNRILTSGEMDDHYAAMS